MAADPNHLERMGRELKCPICLSLLNSSVSLNCNHFFCNSCIMKSMKSGSNCPVCKVPYRRREVRPVPHMDNLVSIYKSMEISSGMNIFITQNVPFTKLSDGKHQVDDCNIHGRQDSGRAFAEKQDTYEEQGSRGKHKADQNSFESVQVRPSFPGKKRVQVPHSQCEGAVDQAVDKLSEKGSRVIRPVVGEKGEPVLSPFFWLRDEENVENLSQDSGKSPFNDMPFSNAPTFSDIKDSDDENSPRSTPDGGDFGKSSNCLDMFDSEMFEWTQRPCSPELCSSPFKTKVADIGVVQEKDPNELANDEKRGQRLSTGNVRFMDTISPPGTSNLDDRVLGKNPKKRGRKARETAGTTRSVKNANLAHEIDVDSDKSSQDMNKTRACKRGKKVHLSATATKPTPENADAVPIRSKASDESHKNMMTELPASLGRKKQCNENLTSKKAGKNSNKIHVQNEKHEHHPVSTKKAPNATENGPGEASDGKNQASKDTIAQLSALFVPLANKDIGSESGDKATTPSQKSKSSDGLRSKRKSRLSCSSNSKDVITHDIQAGSVKSLHANEAKTTENIPNNMDTGSLADPLIVKKPPSWTNDVVLQRCENSLGKIQCAFCLSSEESEASGEMLHYYNGRPVAVDYNGGSKVIHAHRNCIEWAPNVYFDDDVAINLEAELTRSRRIKCSCCGIKGAALGCYDKSCRKSFHVPCAKLMPQCRWDTVNFVMLCPLNPTSNFPSESSDSRARKSKRVTKKSSQVQHNKVAVKHDLGASPNWSSCGSSKKLVLCCSALTSSEREIVSEFERISGVIVAKKWESYVTHVIASTDENGACKRTLKVLMGILDGRWILNIKWIIACVEAMKPVDEEHFEITVDTHGIRDGPQLGRLRVQNKLPKLFDGFKFYFMGEFVPSYKGYLQDLITAAGGTILQRKPVSEYQNDLSSDSLTCQTFIIYSLELPDQCEPAKRNQIFDRRRLDAETLASSSGAKAVSNSWVLNSVAACKLQSLTE